ncbi:MAG: hypothetical protein JOY70_00795 [Acidisphaera sp.]|nr:hypothetical protein [Acidisphaera sp.]MBV9813528.1 hypothetical protein [Acetobacteraceae bacterium]
MRFLRPFAFVAGLLLLGYTASGLFRSRSLLVDTREVAGTVIATSADTETVRYEPVPGTISDWTTHTKTSGAPAGQHVTLLVRSDTNQVLGVGSFWSLFAPFAATGLAGLVLLAIGAAAARRFSRGQAPWS